MGQMMSYLKERFDYIILDTPPVGLVTDAQILGKYADTSLYIVRHRYTLKEQVKLLNNYYKGKRLPNLGVVLNDIKAGDAYRYGYGGYGYGNGYYSENVSDNESLDGRTNGSARNGMQVKKKVEEL
jgi:Mrp family chromosome partitioning ATPase